MPTGVPAASVMRPTGVAGSGAGNGPAIRLEVQVAPASVLTQMSPMLPAVHTTAGVMPGSLAPAGTPLPTREGRKVGPQEGMPLATQREMPPAWPVYWMVHTASGRCAPEFGRSTNV